MSTISRRKLVSSKEKIDRKFPVNKSRIKILEKKIEKNNSYKSRYYPVRSREKPKIKSRDGDSKKNMEKKNRGFKSPRKKPKKISPKQTERKERKFIASINNTKTISYIKN